MKIGEVVNISMCTKTSPSFIEFERKTKKKFFQWMVCPLRAGKLGSVSEYASSSD